MVIIISSETELENYLKESSKQCKLLIIDFFTTWCGACVKFAPEFENLSLQFRVEADFVKLDCDKLQNVALKMNIKILPTIKGYFNTQEVFSLSGSDCRKMSEEIRENSIMPILKTISMNHQETKPLNYLLKIVDNIIENKFEQKYRILKLENISVQQNLLAFDNVKECLFLLGFREDKDRLFMEEPESLVRLKQFRKQLVLLLTCRSNTESGSQCNNLNAIKMNINENLSYAKKNSPTISVSNRKTDLFLNTINSHRKAIYIYENIDLINIVSAIVDMDDYKSLTQESILKKLLRWFKYDFFSWFNTPSCSVCQKPHSLSSNGLPTPEESRWLAYTVEIYTCPTCNSVFRFPRYNHPEKLLMSRTGRCGEWANCFCMILRTFINEGLFEHARFVHDWSDHVWCEVYMKLDGEPDKRWIHVDPCECTYNAPLTYQVGWNKKIDYVIAVSLITGDVQDVTWRYTNDFRKTLSSRHLIDEKILLNKLMEFHKSAGTDVKIIVKELVSFLPINKEMKLSSAEMMGRTTGSEEWRLQRGELGEQPIWRKEFFGKSIIPTSYELENNCIHIQYNCSLDAYYRPCDIERSKYISGDNAEGSSSVARRKSSSKDTSGKNQLSNDTEGWQNLAASWTNIKRKVEYDWEIVYLARMSESSADDPGEISWTVDLSKTNKSIHEISIFASSAEFHNASVKWRLHSGDEEIPVNGFMTTTQFNHVSLVTLSAVLKSDPSDSSINSWQHAQLCRQKSKDFDVKTLQIKIELRDINS